ncbi:MAG TPA: hypothetical protein VG347_06560 [Verrucomicrobiae bacterium]|nr:hypothetical protein [Verrucomicrobiae bacterium]
MKLKRHTERQFVLTTICAALISMPLCNQVNAQSFGVKFLGNTSDNVTGTAGVVAISGWNNIGNGFSSGSILANDGLTAANLTMSGAFPGDGGWHSGATSDGGNGSLMNGYLDLGANIGSHQATSTISGLTGSSYSIYMYIFGDASHPGNSGDWLANYSINGTTYYAAQLGNGTTTYNTTATTVGGSFSGFVQGNTYGANFNTASALPSDFGNYIRIDDVTPVDGAITITGEADAQSWRSPLNGFEIVAVPEPSTWAFCTIGGLALLNSVRRRNK